MGDDPIISPSPEQIYKHIIRCGVRLRARNRTVCSAIMMMHNLFRNEMSSIVCRYSLATACIVLAAKNEEDRDIGVRDVINASHRILHPEGDPAKLDDHMYDVRRGVSELTFVVLRELNFELNFGLPFDVDIGGLFGHSKILDVEGVLGEADRVLLLGYAQRLLLST
ncbi:unnamed protein product [Heligmosomoides polygyrus]|uniref:Cyclin N-terminal domain-containing protein n=1 Tax=Heligmosomoides polygyrus TaxID=6339 RepID=A0A183GTM1_HELPZ|nr:unnamed protein product [Heligmosomoides polygyrus]